MSYGMGVLLLSEVDNANDRANSVTKALNKEIKNHDNYVYYAKGHVHGLRAQVYARKITEDTLIAALKVENANHPLASREVVEKAFQDELCRALLNPEVIKRTYPNGVLPEGIVIGNPPEIVVIDGMS